MTNSIGQQANLLVNYCEAKLSHDEDVLTACRELREVAEEADRLDARFQHAAANLQSLLKARLSKATG